MYATMVTLNRQSAEDIVKDLCVIYRCNYTVQLGKDYNLEWIIYGEQAKMVVKHASIYFWFLGEE